MGKLSENLKSLMHVHNINASELARLTGVSQPVITRIANGTTTNPNVDTLKPISKHFSIDISQLVQSYISTETQTTAQGGLKVPILNWEEPGLWLSKTLLGHHEHIFSDSEVSSLAFALRVQHKLDERFPENTILIIDPDSSATHLDYVVIQEQNSNMTVLKKYIVDGSLKYLKPIDKDLATIQFLPDTHRIIGVVVQAIFNFK